MTGGLPSADTGSGAGGQDLPPIERTMPLAHAVLWEPAGFRSTTPDPGSHPIFITRRAVEAINAHAPPSMSGGVFGFLAGDLCHCPKTGAVYVAVDLLMGLSQPIYGDKANALMANVWPALQNELGKVNRHLLGWYHSHPPLGLMLTPGDVAAHFAHFALPWHVALVVNQGEYGPEAGFYRPIPDEAIPTLPLPFYEIIDPRTRTAEGKLRSFVHWDNYQIHRPAARASLPAVGSPPRVAPRAPTPPPPPLPPPPPSSLPPVVPFPSTEPVRLPPPLPTPPPIAPSEHPARVPTVSSPPRPHHEDVRPSTPVPVRLRSRARLAVTIAGAVAGVAALVFVGRELFGPRATSVEEAPAQATRSDTVPAPPSPAAPAAAAAPSAPTAPAQPAPPNPLAALSDSLTDALQDYQGRAALFNAQRTDCRSLAGGLVAVEQRWLTYSVRRKHLRSPLDVRRAAADSAFYAAMDSVESSYEQSRCPRP